MNILSVVRKKSHKGATLLVIMALLSCLVMMAASVGLNTVSNLNQAEEKFLMRRARFAALGGLQMALSQLREDSSWPGGTGLHELPGPVDLPGSPNLEYRLRILNNVDEGAARIPAIMAPDGSWVPGMAVWVEARARIKGSEKEFGVVALLSRRRPKFEHAAYGYGPVDLRGATVVDGYDSSIGPYTSSFDPGDSTSYQRNASVGSDQSIAIAGGAAVDGDAIVSPEGASSGTPNIAAAGTLSGAEIVAERSKMDLDFKPPSHLRPNMTDISVPNGGTVNLTPGSYRNIELHPGSVLNFAPGTYYVSADFDIDGAVVNTTTDASNPVIIYVGKSMNLRNGAQVNGGESGTPRSLELYFTDEDTSGGSPSSKLRMSGRSELTGLAAGRFLEATIDNSDLFGALIAVGVIADGPSSSDGSRSGIHFDTSVKGAAMNGMATWQMTSVRDQHRGELLSGTSGGGPESPIKPPDYIAFEPTTGGGVTTGGASTGSTGGDSGGSSLGGSTGGDSGGTSGTTASGGDIGGGSTASTDSSGGSSGSTSSSDSGGSSSSGSSSSGSSGTAGTTDGTGSSSGNSSGGGLTGSSGTGGSTGGRGATGGVTTTTGGDEGSSNG